LQQSVGSAGRIADKVRALEAEPHRVDGRIEAQRTLADWRRAMLVGPILPTMLRLAFPTIVVLVVQTFVGVAETYFVSFLGTDALAGVALVFPVLMLM